MQHCTLVICCAAARKTFQAQNGEQARMPAQLRIASHIVGDQSPRKNSVSHIDAPHSRQPLVKGARLVRYEMKAVMMQRLDFECCRLLQNFVIAVRRLGHRSAPHRTKKTLLMHGIR